MHPHPSPSSHRGSRAARRADRRKGRGWRIAACVAVGVLVLGGAGVAAAALLSERESGNDGAGAEPAVPKSSSRLETQPVATTATTLPALPCRSPLTPDTPLRLWIAGDSLAWSVGNGLGKPAANTGVVAPVYESRVSSGLSSPGFFDWSKRVGEELPRLNPEIVVFVMGTNDWMTPQATPVDSSGQPAWKAKYEAQVQAMVDVLARDGRALYWVGPPILREAKQEAGTMQVAEVIKAVVDRAPAAEYVDLHDLLDAADGTYTQTVEIDGRKVFARAGDGIHFTVDGGELVGDAIFKRIDDQCRLKAQAVAGSRQTLVETKGSTNVPGGSTATAPPITVAPTTPVTSPPTTLAPATTVPATTSPATTVPTTVTSQ